MGPNGYEQKPLFAREFLCLWLIAATAQALSDFLSHFPAAALERLLWIPIHSQSARALLIALIAEHSIHLAIAVGTGLIVAHRLGLGAPLLEAWLRGEALSPYSHAPVRPILLIVVLILACSMLSNSSMLHPNRKQDTLAATAVASSPARAKLYEEIDKLGLTATTPYTQTSLAVSYIAGAIGGELDSRLFQLSVILLLLIQIFGDPKTTADRKFLWAAILIAALINTAYNLWARHQDTLLMSELFKTFGLPFRVDPYWLSATRASIPIFPPGLALGWLYSRYGIEAAILASFCGALTVHWFIVFWLMHFSL